MVDVRLDVCDGRNVAVIELGDRMRFLSSALVNGGVHETGHLLILQVRKGYDDPDPEGDLRGVISSLGLPDDTIGLMTAAFLPRVTFRCVEPYGDARCEAVVSAGVSNNVVAGELIPNVEELVRERIYGGTINIVALSDRPLSIEGLVNATMTATEAKSAALRDMGFEGTGTTSDAIAVGCPIGDGSKFAGTATDVGIAMARAVRGALVDSIRGNGDTPERMTVTATLSLYGIDRDVLWATAKELYVECPDWSEDDLRSRFDSRLDALDGDVNACAMVHAANLLEIEGHRERLGAFEHGMFADDPVHLVADEMLGLELSEYIGGTRGMFEFTRYDKAKPGVLSSLGPFMDDIVASLLGGVMSAIYTDLLEGR